MTFSTTRWGYVSLTNTGGCFMVCKAHKKIKELTGTEFIHPGVELEITRRLNYRELSVLSPIKLMSRITRKKTGFYVRLGHYELSGDVWVDFNYEFAQMLYQGSSSLFFVDNANRSRINIDLVRAAWDELTDRNLLLKQYRLPKIETALVKHHIVTHPNRYINVDNNWENKMARPLQADLAGIAEDGDEFYDLLVGSDTNNMKIRYSHPLLLCLLFPYLFTNGRGFYSMKKPTHQLPIHQLIPQEQHLMNCNNITIRQFAKQLLMGKDRRFAKDPSFIFIMLDIIEKQTIFSYNRRVVQLYGATE